MIVPKLHVTPDRIQGCTSWIARLLMAGASCRCIVVNRRLRHVIIDMRDFWVRRRSRVIGFDRISRIVYTAQRMPVISPLRYLSLKESGHSDSALFQISLALEDKRQVHLFTIWERQPRDPDWLDRLAGIPEPPPRVGDEAARGVVLLLRDYLGVPIAPS